MQAYHTQLSPGRNCFGWRGNDVATLGFLVLPLLKAACCSGQVSVKCASARATVRLTAQTEVLQPPHPGLGNSTRPRQRLQPPVRNFSGPRCVIVPHSSLVAKTRYHIAGLIWIARPPTTSSTAVASCTCANPSVETSDILWHIRIVHRTRRDSHHGGPLCPHLRLHANLADLHLGAPPPPSFLLGTAS